MLQSLIKCNEVMQEAIKIENIANQILNLYIL